MGPAKADAHVKGGTRIIPRPGYPASSGGDRDGAATLRLRAGKLLCTMGHQTERGSSPPQRLDLILHTALFFKLGDER